MKQYRILVRIEEINEQEGVYTALGDETEAARFDTLEEAENTVTWFQEGA